MRTSLLSSKAIPGSFNLLVTGTDKVGTLPFTIDSLAPRPLSIQLNLIDASPEFGISKANVSLANSSGAHLRYLASRLFQKGPVTVLVKRLQITEPLASCTCSLPTR